MNQHDQNELREALKKRLPDAAESAHIRRHLEAHPDEAADWEAEMLLTDTLQRLPDAPLSSNFTARVLRAAELEAGRNRPAGNPVSAWARSFSLFQYATAVVVILLAGWFAWQQRTVAFEAKEALAIARADMARAALARDAATLHASSPVPTVEMLQDFEAIARLGSWSTDVDLDLLAAVNIVE